MSARICSALLERAARKGLEALCLESCRSTQDVARGKAEAGAPEWLVVVAERMEGGRGRRGRKWHAPLGGLWLTVVLRPKSSKSLKLLPLAASSSVAKALRELYGLPAGVKWPNDVVCCGRKVAGVLVEAKVRGCAPEYALVGVGVNANNELPEELKGTAASLSELLGRPVELAELFEALLDGLRKRYEAIEQGRGEEVLAEWAELSTTLGRRVRVLLEGGREVAGLAEGLGADGSLLLLLGNGTRVKVSPYEAELVREL